MLGWQRERGQQLQASTATLMLRRRRALFGAGSLSKSAPPRIESVIRIAQAFGHGEEHGTLVAPRAELGVHHVVGRVDRHPAKAWAQAASLQACTQGATPADGLVTMSRDAAFQLLPAWTPPRCMLLPHADPPS
jgi:hypothetical protein